MEDRSGQPGEQERVARQLGPPQERRASGNSPRNSLELHDTPEKAVNCLSFGYLPAGALGIVGFRSIGRDTTRRDVSKPIGSGRDGGGPEPVGRL